MAARVTASVLTRGAQSVISGCTEIPMVITAAEVDVPHFDALALHADAAIAFAVGD